MFCIMSSHVKRFMVDDANSYPSYVTTRLSIYQLLWTPLGVRHSSWECSVHVAL